MESPGGIEPRTVLPTLRSGLEDHCRGRGQKILLLNKSNSRSY